MMRSDLILRTPESGKTAHSRELDMLLRIRGIGAIGSARPSQGRGTGIETQILHFTFLSFYLDHLPCARYLHDAQSQDAT